MRRARAAAAAAAAAAAVAVAGATAVAAAATAGAALSAVAAAAALTATARVAYAEDRGPSADTGDEAGKWLEARVKRAKTGEREVVRVPLVKHGPGWGCDCPDYFVGTDTVSHGGGDTWLNVVVGPGVELPTRTDGWVVVAEGYLTGRMSVYEGDGEKYKLWELDVLRTRAFKDTDDKDRYLYLVLWGDEAKKEVAPLADARPWLTIAASLPLLDKSSEKKAEELRAKLAAAGFAGAEVVDGRRVPLLFCCYRVVLAGRFATQKEAEAAAKGAKAKKFAAYVKRGWGKD